MATRRAPTSLGRQQPDHSLANVADLWRASAGFIETAQANATTPKTRRTWIERLLCYDYEDYLSRRFKIPNFSDQDWFLSFGPFDVLFAPSGDFNCFWRPNQFYAHSQSAIGLLTGWSKWTSESSAFQVDPVTTPPEGVGWLAQCLEDLRRPLSTVTGTTDEELLQNWFGAPGACVNLPQLFPALGALVHDSIDGTGERYIDRADSTLLQRLLAQWLDVHGFVLQQGVQESRAQAHLANELISESYDPVRLEDILAQAERAWDVLFDPDFLDALARVPRDNLAEPDYRIPRPTAYWTFDAADRNGNHFLDAAGERHLDFSGSHAIAVDGGIELGDQSYATLPPGDLELAPHGDVTLSFWFKPSSLPTSQARLIFTNYDAFRVSLYKASNGEWRIALRHGSPSEVQNTANQLDSSDWTHIAIVRSGTNYTVYKDGAPLPSLSFAAVPVYDPGETTQLLSQYYETSSAIVIDDLAIWEQALSAPMIAQVYDGENLPDKGRSTATNPRPLLKPIGQLWDPESPDYQGDDPNAEQGLGLAVKIAETASKHAATVEMFAAKELEAVYGGCYQVGKSTAQQRALERAASGLRYVGTAEALARDLRHRAAEVLCTEDLECTYAGGATCGAEGLCLNGDQTLLERPLAWAERFDSAMRELGAARGRAVTAMNKLARCENPLGIPENDQPIYFGDVQGENSRYFASSDYLVEAWSRPAVQNATNALEAARGAWLAARDSDIRQLMTEYEAERRLESLELGYMNPVMDACGITTMDGLEVLDAFERGPSEGGLDVGTCYRQPGCEPADDPSCLRGTLGEAMLSVKTAAKEVATARNQSERQLLEWFAQMDTCRFTAESIGASVAAVETYRVEAEAARKKARGFLGWATDKIGEGVGYITKGTIDGDALGALLEDTIVGCFNGATTGAQAGPAGVVAGCAVFGQMAMLTSDQGGARDLDEARDHLNQALELGRLEREMRACYDEVYRRQRDWLSGQDSILIREADLGQAFFRFEELGRGIVRNLQEARAALNREEGRTLPSVAHHYWTDEKIDRFEKDFERAKRLTYLAMRAVEYEFQQSLGLRTDILTASHPDVLLGALYVLDAERGTRTINSRRPAAGIEVLSLRTDILRLGNLDPPAPGERSDSASLRLQDMLRDPQYAYRDEDGNYLGQAIPFSLEESGALRHRCGERLWRVNATIQGDLTDIDEPRAQVLCARRTCLAASGAPASETGRTTSRRAPRGAATCSPRTARRSGDKARNTPRPSSSPGTTSDAATSTATNTPRVPRRSWPDAASTASTCSCSPTTGCSSPRWTARTLKGSAALIRTGTSRRSRRPHPLRLLLGGRPLGPGDGSIQTKWPPLRAGGGGVVRGLDAPGAGHGRGGRAGARGGNRDQGDFAGRPRLGPGPGG
jgi:hypothetical protein